MNINKQKSGFLYLNKPVRELEQIENIPRVKEYKYLGMIIEGSLKPFSHLQHINKKINFLTYKLYPFRKLNNLKLSINLFKTFILPQYRLITSVYMHCCREVRR